MSRGWSGEKLSPAARERLLAHSWPGNVRELENALERALIVAGEAEIGPELAIGSGAARGKRAYTLLASHGGADRAE